VRFREDNSRELARARAAVAVWRDQNPAGTSEQLVGGIGSGFHPDYGRLLRAVLFTVDRHRARITTGIPVAGPACERGRARAHRARGHRRRHASE
jgi:hypothetical protein